jgi:hypothetical protein
MGRDIVILRDSSYLRGQEQAALERSMHTGKMTFPAWAYGYQEICDKLGVQSGIEIRQELVESFRPDNDTYRIVISGSREENQSIEARLLRKHDVGKKLVNATGEQIIKNALRKGGSPESLVPLLGKGYTAFPYNKALTYLALDQSWAETIPLYGYGHRSPLFRGRGIFVDSDKVVIKPVDRSHGDGIEFVRGDDIDVMHNPLALFGSHLVQEYVGAPKELRDLPQKYNSKHNGTLKLCTDMRVMPTRLDKGYGLIGHIRVALNSSGKANLSQNTETAEERAYAIGLNAKQPITRLFDREICKIYGIDPDKPKVPAHIATRSAELMKKFGRPLLGLDYCLGEKDGKKVLKLLEANVTPGSAIYTYIGATKSPELQRFVRREGLHKLIDKLSVDQLNLPAEELAAHRVVNILAKVRAFMRVRVDGAMDALGLDNSIYGGDYAWPKK